MANLIITIISIALVAVAALMGAYYGGTAFLQGQGKAYANSFVSQGEQIIAAWSIYAADRGGSWTLANVAALSSVSPAYITSAPQPPAGVTNSAAPSVWTTVNLSDISAGTSTTFNAVYVRLTDDSAGANVCNLVSQMIGGSSALPTRTSVANNINGSTGKFGCVFVNTSASVLGTGDTKYIYYRAY
ncbi:MAG TPA: hypothetical protein PKW15_01590 [Alphaproteobacteria bacterium]|nr:hypothetical protein [Rhodospirillaceae bacterium]HRJ11917.1 hypothetical protein [Alphaproteobacteria bacterium]